MAEYKYAYQGQGTYAKAVARDVSLSTKTAIMLANFVRNKPVSRVQKELAEVIAKKKAVPFTRFTEGAGHKPGMGPGKFPEKGAKIFLALVNNAEANAKDKGMGEELAVIACTAHRGASQYKYGRHRGRQTKSSHIELIVEEVRKVSKKSKFVPLEEKKETKPAAKKAPAKKAPAKKAPAKAAKPAEKKGAPAKEEKKAEPKKEEPKTEAKESKPEQKVEEKPKEEAKDGN